MALVSSSCPVLTLRSTSRCAALRSITDPVPVQGHEVAFGQRRGEPETVDRPAYRLGDRRPQRQPLAVPGQRLRLGDDHVAVDADHLAPTDPAAVEHDHGLRRTPGVAQHGHPGIDAEHREAVVGQGAGGQGVLDPGEERSAASRKGPLGGAGQGLRADPVELRPAEPVGLDHPGIECVGESVSVGDQLQVGQRAIEVAGHLAQSMIIGIHPAGEEAGGIVGSAVAEVVGREGVPGEQDGARYLIVGQTWHISHRILSPSSAGRPEPGRPSPRRSARRRSPYGSAPSHRN